MGQDTEESTEDGGEPVENQEQLLQIGINCVNLTKQHGFAHFERYICSNCGQSQFCIHSGTEAFPCQKCGTINPSRISPPKVKGEVTAAHYQMALSFMMDCATATNLTPVRPEELAALTPEMRLLVVRYHEMQTYLTAKKGVLVARKLAETFNE